MRSEPATRLDSRTFRQRQSHVPYYDPGRTTGNVLASLYQQFGINVWYALSPSIAQFNAQSQDHNIKIIQLWACMQNISYALSSA
jgi:hypothetical protein